MIIDGQKVPYLLGDSIMDVARRAKIDIPGLCYNGAMDHDNCCRLCMVEIKDGSRDVLVAACAYDARSDLEVTTISDRVTRIRKTMLKLLYSQAPGNKVIMELLEKYGVKPEKRFPEKDSQCILCGLCVKNCKIFVNTAISAVNRGIHKKIDTPFGEPGEDCVGCATCAQACPIKAIEVKDNGSHREIWNNHFELLYCEDCGKVVTTKENYYAGNNPDAPVLCHWCSEKYRLKQI